MIARILIITAAFKISWKWGLGVLLPFGPMMFRRNYPDDARPARPFQLAALPCFLIFILAGPSFSSINLPKPPAPSNPKGYAVEKPAPAKSSSGSGSFLKSVLRTGPSVEDRKAANAKELERLAEKDKELKTRKRDLLRSDVQGQAAYERDFAAYNTALAKANAEKAELATAGK